MDNERPDQKAATKWLWAWSQPTVALAAAALIVLATAGLCYLFAARLPYLANEYRAAILVVFSLGALFAVIVLQQWWRAKRAQTVLNRLQDDEASVFEFVDDRLTQIIEQEGIDR